MLFVLCLAIALQILALVLALRLIPITRGRVGWLLLSVAIAFMLYHRVIALYDYLTGDVGYRLEVTIEFSALAIALCMAAGMTGLTTTLRHMRQTSDRLADREDEQRAFFQLATVGMAEGDPHTGRLLRVNDHYCQLTGYSEAELLQMDFRQLTHPDDRKADADIFDKAVRGETPAYLNEKRYVRKDGSAIWVHINASMIRDRTGRAIRTASIVRDVTARRLADEERTMLLQREKDSRAAAEAASKTKDQFLAILSHELRTPLTPVLARVMLLQRKGAWPPEMASDLDMIRRNIELEARLIGDLMDVTSLAHGKLQYHLETVDAHEALNHALAIYQTAIEAHHHTLTVHLQARPAYVRADPIRLQQIFWNLIGNAVKYTPDGGRIWIDSWVDHDGMLKVKVRDNGIGIAPDLMPRLFTAFVQGEASLSRHYGGLGLGLNISQQLARLQGGDLIAASEGPARGATFTLSLRPAPVPVPAEAASTGPAVKQPTPSCRVLIVEDHEDTIRVLTFILRNAGYAVSSAASMQAALDLVKAQPFDLLLCDIGLPDGTGWELMRRLASRHIKGIAISGFATADDIERSRAAGFLEHLTKPISVEKLEATLQYFATQNSVN